MKEICLKVNGMVCHGCEKRIQNVLESIDEVKSVTANYESGIVTVIFTNELAESVILTKIQNLGFEIVKEN